MKTAPIPEISVKIGREEIRLQSRAAGMVALLAKHQTSINSAPHMKVIFDCAPTDVELSIQPKLGKIKVGK